MVQIKIDMYMEIFNFSSGKKGLSGILLCVNVM